MRQFALGCAFTILDILYNFPYKKLKLTCEQCKKQSGDNHKQRLVRKIFRYALNLVLDDIIERNITFWLPLAGAVKCNLHMHRFTGKAFKDLRRGGKWQDVDILQSNFSGYQIGMYMFGKRTPRVKNVYVNAEKRSRVSKYTNEGKAYGDGAIDTTINDYIDKVKEQFPLISKSDIKRILSYSWKSLYLHNSYGGDVLIKDGADWIYFGNLKRSAIQHYHYYIKKLSIKLKVMYRKKKIPWDGYYYFALTNTQYKEYLQQTKAKGRKRKYYSFTNIMMYQILDDCRISEAEKQYIFRTQYIATVNFRFFIHNFKAPIELVEMHPPLKFKDILINENEYEFL